MSTTEKGATWPPATLLTKLTDDEIRARMLQLYGRGPHHQPGLPSVDYDGIAKARSERGDA